MFGTVDILYRYIVVGESQPAIAQQGKAYGLNRNRVKAIVQDNGFNREAAGNSTDEWVSGEDRGGYSWLKNRLKLKEDDIKRLISGYIQSPKRMTFKQYLGKMGIFEDGIRQPAPQKPARQAAPPQSARRPAAPPQRPAGDPSLSLYQISHQLRSFQPLSPQQMSFLRLPPQQLSPAQLSELQATGFLYNANSGWYSPAIQDEMTSQGYSFNAAAGKWERPQPRFDGRAMDGVFLPRLYRWSTTAQLTDEQRRQMSAAGFVYDNLLGWYAPSDFMHPSPMSQIPSDKRQTQLLRQVRVTATDEQGRPTGTFSLFDVVLAEAKGRLAEYVMQNVNSGRLAFDVVLASGDILETTSFNAMVPVENKLFKSLKPKLKEHVFTYPSFIVSTNDIENVNAMYLIPRGYRITRVTTRDNVPNRAGGIITTLTCESLAGQV